MNKRTLLIAALLLLSVGVGVYALLSNEKSGSNGSGPQATRASGHDASGGSDMSGPDATAATTSKTKTGKGNAWAKLTEKYGTTRTNLSKKVTADIADVLDQSIELADMGAQMTGSKTAAEAASKETVKNLANKLGLTEEQQKKASDLIQDAIGKRMGAVKELTGAMRDDPGSMMEMLLAGDAVTRKEMTQAEYDSTTADTRGMLQNISSFVVGRNPSAIGGPLFSDPQFTSQISAMLTPDQQALFTQYSQQMADQAAQSSQGGRLNLPLQNGQIPVMSLDNLDQTITSAKQMAGGARQLLEGMKGLQKANPQTTP